MNRLFPGSSKGCVTQRIADKLMTEVVSQADMVIAIHSGGNNIHCCNRSIIPNDSTEQVRLAKAMGPGWDFVAQGAGERKQLADLCAIAAQSGTTSITLEIGGVSDRLPDRFNANVQDVVSAIENTLKEYNMIDGSPAYASELVMLEYEPIRNNHGGLIVFGETCRPKKEVKAGEELLRIVDIFGDTLEVIEVPYDGIMLAIPSQVVVPEGGCQIGSIGKVVQRVKTNK
jgi:N-alpha-acetyl-L-2,4-diaminobutyrate deacetylase